MSDELHETTDLPAGHGFADTPSKEKWLELLSDLSAELEQIEHSACTMRERIAMISRRLSKS